MGADIALVLARGECRTFVVETSAERRAALPEYFSRAPAGPSAWRELVTVGGWTDAPWPTCDLAVECVVEELAAKRAVFAELVSRCRPDALLVSNSSSLPISAIAEGQSTDSRMLGWHFFYPATLVPLVEIILGASTAAAHADTMTALSRRCGLVPIVVKKDVPGFVANRLQHALAREAYALIDAGVVSPEDVDRAVRFGFGFRYLAAGPLLQRDHGGLDVHVAAATQIYPTLANASEVPRSVRERVIAGKTGLKSGEGFYRWPPALAAAERTRYERMLRRALELLKEEMPG
jgi:3-hydroxybutyryl-CoA dehydrogenase